MAYMMRNNNRYNNNCTQCDDTVKYERINPKELALPLAMAYVPWQNMDKLYDCDTGFIRGTIFPELDKPFEGSGGGCR